MSARRKACWSGFGSGIPEAASRSEPEREPLGRSAAAGDLPRGCEVRYFFGAQNPIGTPPGALTIAIHPIPPAISSSGIITVAPAFTSPKFHM